MEKETNELKFLKDTESLFGKPRLLIPLDEWKKICAWTMMVPGEINGLGLIERKGNDLLVREAFILKEKVSPVSADIDPLAFNQYVGECDDPSKIRLQWHSHANFSAGFFSQEKDIKGTIAKWTGEYLISLVLNKKGEHSCRLDIFDPIYLGFEIPVLVVISAEKEVTDFCLREIAEKVQFSGGLFKRKKRKFEWDQETNPLTLPLETIQFSHGGEDD